MNMLRHRLAATALMLYGAVAVAGKPPENHLNFVSCPIVRDTASVPCWLSEYEGELYFLTLQTDVSAPVTPPWLGHRVLVEGVVKKDAPRICGGIVLEPVKLSVLPEIDKSCNTILPAEDRYNLTFEPPRPPGPSKGRLAFDRGPARPAAEAEQPSGPREFKIEYDFNGKVMFRHPRFLTPVLNYARAIDAKEIEVIGYRVAALLSNGETIVEREGIAKERAEQVAELLQGAGLKGPKYHVTWKDEPPLVDGVEDFVTRNVTVKVKP
jgi:hypothetical protein